MKRVHISQIKPGSRVFRTILNDDGGTLLAEGMVLTTNFIRRLKRLGCEYVEIDDQPYDQSISKEIITEKTKAQAVDCMKEILENINRGKTVELDSAKQVVNCIIEDVIDKQEIMLNLVNIQSYDDYTFSHCINVTVVSVMIGLSLNYDVGRLFELGLGVFLHDLGKIFIPRDIINKITKLTDNESEIVKRHPWYGFTLLYNNPEINYISACVALQHHERYDGTGYPQQLKRSDICEFARICAIADVYDALSNNRPYRDRLPSHKVFEYLLRNIGSHFDPYILDKFIRKIAMFPEGTRVKLSDGRSGYVIGQNALYPFRPVVEICHDRERELPEPVTVNLLDTPSLAITEVLD